jgi:sec-independent protein translocase protein TatA
MPSFIGFPELIVLVIVLLLIFGPKRLPEIGRSMGKGMREFKDSVTGKDDEPAELTATPLETAAPTPAAAAPVPVPVQEPTPTAPAPTPVERDQSATGS